MHLLRDGRRHSLPALAGHAGASVGDVRHALTLAWEHGAPVDSDDDDRADWWWWRTDIVADTALLLAIRHGAPPREGVSRRHLCAATGVSRSAILARLRAARDLGHVTMSGRTAAARYHLTAAGDAALEQTA
jgi:hypothetical protein